MDFADNWLGSVQHSNKSTVSNCAQLKAMFTILSGCMWGVPTYKNKKTIPEGALMVKNFNDGCSSRTNWCLNVWTALPKPYIFILFLFFWLFKNRLEIIKLKLILLMLSWDYGWIFSQNFVATKTTVILKNPIEFS